MPYPRIALPQELSEVFTTEQAQALGVSRGRLRCDDLEHPFIGVYRRRNSIERARIEGLPPGRAWVARQRLRAQEFALIMPAGSFFTGRTAAAIWDLPIPPGGSDDIEVGVFAPARAIRRSAVRGSQIRRHLVQTTLRTGLPTLTPASTWVVLAQRLALPDRVALGDAVLKHTRIPGTDRYDDLPLGTLQELAQLAAPARPGVTLLRHALPFLVTASASPPESHLRFLLHEWGFPDPSLDVDVRGLDGRLLGCSELAYPEFRLALEYEGDHHRVLVEQWNRDIQKYHDYSANGWSVVRVTATLQYQQPLVLRGRIRDALRRGGWDGETSV
ncbi:hypothetical protein ACR5KS_07340 [Leucobacter sp. W1153]